MANLPTSIKNLNTLLGEQLTEGGGGGSSDFSTAEVTVTISTHGAYIGLPVVMLGGEGEEGFAQALEIGESGVYSVILYEGNCTVFAESYTDGKMAVVAVTGNAETMGDSVFTIKGDCAVTVTLEDDSNE